MRHTSNYSTRNRTSHSFHSFKRYITLKGTILSFETEDKSMDKLQSAEFRQQVEQLILKTVTSKPFIDSIVDAILPTLLDSMRKNDTNNTVCSEQTTLPSTTPDSVEAETSSSSVANELINFLEPQEPAESDSVPSDEDSGEKKEEEASEQNSSEVEPGIYNSFQYLDSVFRFICSSAG
jgi:hypothetical protein